MNTTKTTAPANGDSGRLLDVAELAKHYGVSESTIYRRRCYHPELLPPFIKIANRVRWRPEDVHAWDEKHVKEYIEDDTENTETNGEVAEA